MDHKKTERMTSKGQDKKFKIEPIKKLGKLATKVKLFFKAHFPKRVWSKPQQNRKGPKF